MTVSRPQRFSRTNPCPICGGGDGAPRGQGWRCWGFLSQDGQWAHCAREEHAVALERHAGSQTYAHRLTGDCRCGVRHEARPLSAAPSRSPADPIVATFDYRDEAGTVLFRVVRTAGKQFWQQQPDGAGGWRNGIEGVRRVLYRLPELRAADPRVPVYVPEGEKHVDALWRLGRVATCNPGGAGKWRDEFSEALRGRRVVILPDNDKAGRDHAARIAESLRGVAAAVRILDLPGLPPKGDVLDWLDAGGTPEALDQLAEADGDGPVLVRLSAVTPRVVEWVWPGRLPRGKVSLLGGDPGLGKSHVLLDAAARLSTGAAWPDSGQAPLGHVVLLTAEDGLDDTVVPRLKAMGADLGRITALTATRQQGRERTFSLATDLPWLEAAIVQMRPVAVFVDPLTAYLGGVDSHTDGDVRGLLAPLAKLAADYHLAVVGLMHLNKAIQMRALYRIGGSIAFTAAARAVFAVVPDPQRDTRRLFVPVKMNLAPMPPALAFTLTGAGLAWEAEPVTNVDLEAAFRGPGDPDEQAERQSAAEWLVELLATAPMPVREIEAYAAESKAASWRSIERAKTKLGVVADRVGRLGEEGYWVWRLPKTARPAEVAALAEPVVETGDSARRSPKTATMDVVSVLGGEVAALESGQLAADRDEVSEWTG